MASYNESSSTFCESLDYQICIVGDALAQNESFMETIKVFDLPIVYSSSGLEYVDGERTLRIATIFAVESFESDIFKRLLAKGGKRIIGPTAVYQCARNSQKIPELFQSKSRIRPLYTLSMKGATISFTGFQSKEALTWMVDYVHYMGGSIRKEFNIKKTSHLVCAPIGVEPNEKYYYAACVSIPIMTAEWVRKAWEERDNVDCDATSEEWMKYKMPTFMNLKFAFFGFSDKSELEEMVQLTNQHGASVGDVTDHTCTHIIVQDNAVVDFPMRHPRIMRKEWFWASIQVEARSPEEEYIIQDRNLEASIKIHSDINCKKRIASISHHLANENKENSGFFFEASASGKVSLGQSHLDATFSPNSTIGPIESNAPVKCSGDKTETARYQVVRELFQTESNYFNILETIMTLFKAPLEDLERAEGQLLAPTEIKIIFGNLPQIFDIHLRLKSELYEILNNWTEQSCVGAVILNYAHEFVKAYPPFINFFEKSQSVLASCDATKPKFHAFLKKNQSNPGCGRQSLQELLIRPVQRLPSVILLLNDILKKTPRSNPDYEHLEKAISVTKEVLTHINEDKRKSEVQLEMFEIMNDIENCPADFLASHRTLISKHDIQESTDYLHLKKSAPLTMFFFTDMIEICKKKSKTAHTLKSPSMANLGAVGTLTRNQNKTHKHVSMIKYRNIMKIVNIKDSLDDRLFSIQCKFENNQEVPYIFEFTDGTDKEKFLRTFSQHVDNFQCHTNTANLLSNRELKEMKPEESEPSQDNIFTKAIKCTRSKLGRALSMRRTPLKRTLTRAVSQLMSPHSSHLDSPSGSMYSLRLSSADVSERPPSRGVLTPSPIGTKKLKSSSYGFGSSKYL